MRKPKKLTALLLALTLLFACAACGSGNSTTDSGKTISGTLPEIIDRLYDTVDVDDEQRDFLKNSVGTVEIPKDQSAYYFGVENLDFEEAVASEPLINAIAFSVCLMRVKDGTDIDELKAEIRRSANPAKWQHAEGVGRKEDHLLGRQGLRWGRILGPSCWSARCWPRRGIGRERRP